MFNRLQWPLFNGRDWIGQQAPVAVVQWERLDLFNRLQWPLFNGRDWMCSTGSSGRCSMGEIGCWSTGSSGRCSMGEIGCGSTGSSGRCSMGEIGCVQQAPVAVVQWEEIGCVQQAPVAVVQWERLDLVQQAPVAVVQWRRLDVVNRLQWPLFNGGDWMCSTGSSGRCSMGEIGCWFNRLQWPLFNGRDWIWFNRLQWPLVNGRDWMCSTGSSGRCSMGEIGFGQQAPVAVVQWGRLDLWYLGCQKFLLRLCQNPAGGPTRIRAPSRKLRSFEIARRNTRNGIRKRTGSPPKYLQAQRGRWRARAAIYTQAGLVPSLGVVSKPLTHAVLSEQRYFSQLLPRSNWTGAALYRSDHTRGVITKPPHHTALS